MLFRSRKKGKRKAGISRIVVYSRSSAHEQLLNMTARRAQSSMLGSPHPFPDEILDVVKTAKVTAVDTLDELVGETKYLDPGDFVIAWPPLSDGLLAQDPELCQVGERFMHWISLYCRHDCLDLADEFLWLFAYEFNTCHRFREYAKSLIFRDTFFWDHFSGAAGFNK